MEKEKVVFKSTPEYWNKENLGLKRNTVRKKDTDTRFNKLDLWCAGKNNLDITIVNTKTQEEFTREVKDVSKFDDYYIVSW